MITRVQVVLISSHAAFYYKLEIKYKNVNKIHIRWGGIVFCSQHSVLDIPTIMTMGYKYI